jgi:hypothetical protein
MSYAVIENVGYRTGEPATRPHNAIEYESKVYQKGLRFERPPLTYQTQKWEEEAQRAMSPESRVGRIAFSLLRQSLI